LDSAVSSRCRTVRRFVDGSARPQSNPESQEYGASFCQRDKTSAENSCPPHLETFGASLSLLLSERLEETPEMSALDALCTARCRRQRGTAGHRVCCSGLAGAISWQRLSLPPHSNLVRGAADRRLKSVATGLDGLAWCGVSMRCAANVSGGAVANMLKMRTVAEALLAPQPPRMRAQQGSALRTRLDALELPVSQPRKCGTGGGNLCTTAPSETRRSRPRARPRPRSRPLRFAPQRRQALVEAWSPNKTKAPRAWPP